MPYYGVRVGKVVGVFTDWRECYKSSVGGFPSAVYKKFSTYEEAENWVAGKDAKSLLQQEAIDSVPDGKEYRSSTGESMVVDSSTAILYASGGINPSGTVIGHGGIFVYNGVVTEVLGCDTYGSETNMQKIFGEIISVMKLISLCHRNGVKKALIRYDYTGIEAWARGSWRANNQYSILYKRFMEQAAKTIEISFERVKPRDNKLMTKASNLAQSAIRSNNVGGYAEFLHNCAMGIR